MDSHGFNEACSDVHCDSCEEEYDVQVVPSVFVPDIELAIQEFIAKWQDRDESLNFAQRCVWIAAVGSPAMWTS
jgi:hypothetical protein